MAFYQPPRPDLRASDADREATVDRLHRAATEGRLDADELDERLTATYAAKTCRELERLTADVTPAPARAWGGPPAFVAPTRRTSGLAIGSLLAGMLWFSVIGGVIAIVLGHAALRQIGASGGRVTGRVPATIGLLLGYVGILVFAVGFFASRLP